MRALPWIIVGLMAPLWLGSDLFARPLLPPLVAFAAGALLLIHCKTRFAALMLLASAWTLLSIGLGLEHRIESLFEGPVEGEVVSLPVRRFEGVAFVLRTSQGPWDGASRRLDAFWPEAEVMPLPGERWRFTMKVRPTRGRINFQGADRERQWFAARIHGVATVKGPGERIAPAADPSLDRWRHGVRGRLESRTEGLPGRALVLALGLGERQYLSDELRRAMVHTGTGHLLAISGLHVGMVAVFVFLVARTGLALSQVAGARWPPQRLALLVGMGGATAYALLAGFGTSPRRAVIMLAVAFGVWLMRRRLGSWRAWGLALMLVLISDPLSPLEAGFWLSFGAVGVLLAMFTGKSPRPRGLGALVQAQAVIALALVPLGMLWFQFAGLAAPWINLLAIPWVSFITLPLVLLTLLTLPMDGAVGEIIAQMACRSAWLLERGLLWLVGGQAEALPGSWLGFQVAAPGTLNVCLGIGGGLLLLAPRGLALRRFAPMLWLPLFVPADSELGPGEFMLEVLDVGQGQAVIVRTLDHSLLVDAGPGMPDRWSLSRSVIQPALRQFGTRRPDLLLISHGDLDHAGGLPDLTAAWPDVSLLGNLRAPPADMSPCTDARGWTWDGVDFHVLHPTPWLPYRGNDSSCVLSISSDAGAVLLPGDIGRLVERRLLLDGIGQHEVLLAAHHGSRSSSTEGFIDQVRPNLVLFSSGFGNRFGFPHPEIVSRFQTRNIRVAETARCGALRFQMLIGGERRGASARASRRGFWRWPAGPECPDR